MNRERELNDRAVGRLVDGTAQSARVIGKGDKERLVPLPEKFGQVFGFWLKDRTKGDYVFARALGQKPVSSQAARAYLRGMLKKAGIEKKISPHKLRHTYATNRLNAGAELVDIQALLGHESVPPPRLTPTWGRKEWKGWWGGCEDATGDDKKWSATRNPPRGRVFGGNRL